MLYKNDIGKAFPVVTVEVEKGRLRFFAKKTGEQNPMYAISKDMTEQAAQQVYNKAGINPQDIDVIELHDCFTTNEVSTYEALGFAVKVAR